MTCTRDEETDVSATVYRDPRADCWCADNDLPCFEHFQGGPSEGW